MKHIRKVMAVVFALALCLGMLPGAAAAEGAESAKAEKTIFAAGTAEIKAKTNLSASLPRNGMLTFSSDAPFTIATANHLKNWNGTLYYSTNAQNWTVWNGAATLASGAHGGQQRLYLRGIGNTVISGQNGDLIDHGWILSGGEVACSGNIENLLNYQTVAAGAHPAMADYCFNSLFYGQDSLVSAPELPATTLSKYCYASMFCGCYALSAAPALPAKTLAENCYASMFDSCSSLRAAPKLPATTLAKNCYSGMFFSSGLVTLPELPAVELPQGCYFMMFAECPGIRLSEIWTNEYCFPYRIPSVEQSQHVGWIALDYMFSHTGGPFTGTPVADRVYYLPAPAELSDNQVLTFSDERPFTLKTANGEINWDGRLFYSTDKVLWTEWDGTEIASCLQDGREKLYLCGVWNTVIAGEVNYRWVLTGTAGGPVPQPGLPPQRWLVDGPNITCSGNIENLLDFRTVSAGEHPRMGNGCFSHLFYECKDLVSAPRLPATELTPSCYEEMFCGTGLTFAPALPAMELSLECYSGMFRNCTTLRAAPVLPATTLAEGCYYTMFAGCTSLKKAPVLPATEMSDGCYSWMFADCVSLAAAPALPAMMLAEECYFGMFRGCTALPSVAVLPGRELAPFCYALMYKDCTALTLPAELPATGLSEGCYWEMFNGCTGIRLSEILTFEYNVPYRIPSVEQSQYVGAHALLDMFSRTGGPFADTPEADRVYYLPGPGSQSDDGVLTFGSAAPFTLATANGVKNWNGTLEYSTDLEHWTAWDGAATISSAVHNNWEMLYLRGTGNTVISGQGNNTDRHGWVLTGSNIACSGNIENLLDYQTVVAGGHPQMVTRCFAGLFYGCSNLISTPELPTMQLAYTCYEGMFQSCTSLTAAPALPATTLVYGCYSGMFSGCTSLTSAPVLPATTLADYCYSSMFAGCTSLTTAPALPATVLANSCYFSMFGWCSSLTAAPALPATELVKNCYQGMFQHCTSLTVAPALSSTMLAEGCYDSMFLCCTSLTTASALPATTLAENCYQAMFLDCRSLTTAPAILATTVAPHCCESMFDGCLSMTNAPSLLALNTAPHCYDRMFYHCESMTSIPALRASVLDDYCYYEMFYGCCSIRLSPVQTGEYLGQYAVPIGQNAQHVGENALTEMFRYTGGAYIGTPTANTAYYLHSSNSIVW